MEKKQQEQNRKQITMRLRPDMIERWNRVAKKYGWTRTQMVEDFLEQVLPILEEDDPRGLFSATARKIGESMLEMGDLIDGRNVKSK